MCWPRVAAIRKLKKIKSTREIVMIIEILRNTPVWVWVLLVFLIFRGIKALETRRTTLQRVFLLPVIFLVWSLWSIVETLTMPVSGFGGFAIGLMAGAGVSFAIPVKPAHYVGETGLIERPGSIRPLCLILIFFISKYSLEVYRAIHPALADTMLFCIFYGVVCGVSTGLFWGNLRAIPRKKAEF